MWNNVLALLYPIRVQSLECPSTQRISRPVPFTGGGLTRLTASAAPKNNVYKQNGKPSHGAVTRLVSFQNYSLNDAGTTGPLRCWLASSGPIPFTGGGLTRLTTSGAPKKQRVQSQPTSIQQSCNWLGIMFKHCFTQWVYHRSIGLLVGAAREIPAGRPETARHIPKKSVICP